MTSTYGALVLEHFRRPRNQGRLERPTTSREGVNPLCGDRVRIELAIEGGVITAAAFTANACAICTASASMLTERIQGAPLAEAAMLGDDAMLDMVGDVPPGRRTCATLPLRTMHEALADHTAT